MIRKNLDIIDDKEVSASDILELDNDSVEIISNPEEFQEMSLALIEEQKKSIQNLRQQTLLKLDRNKLEQVDKYITTMEYLQDILTDSEMFDRVKGNIKTAQDLKFLTEAVAKMADVQQKLSRVDSINGNGAANKVKLAIQFDSGNGTQVKTYIETGE